jgi:hypothetical protein
MTTTTIPSPSAPEPVVVETESPAPSGGLLPAVMRSEWTKLRSVRSTMWSLFATFAITVGLGVVFCFAYLARYDNLGLRDKLTFDPTAQSLRGLFLAQVAIGVLGVLVVSSEYATGLIRSTFTATPQRRVVLTAKAVVFGAVALVVTMVSVFAAFFIGQAVLAGKSLGVGLSDPGVLRGILGAGAYLTIVGLLGLALGAIVRRTAGAIATLFGLVLVLQLLAQALPSPWNTDVAKFVPGGLGAALYSVRPDSNLLSPGVALLVALGWLAAAFTLAFALIKRRDA